MIAIIDYGMGNIHSVNKALTLFGSKTVITADPEEIKNSAKVVLPGVGAFDDAMLELEKLKLTSVIQDCVKQGKPLLGICLGMQLLFEQSQEAVKQEGLKILKGKVVKFDLASTKKVPHMGWNQVKQVKAGCPLLKGIANDSFVYFCHSYYPQPKDESVTAATTDYGVAFSSVVWQGNVYGVQFHPEKSQGVGLAMIKNFVELC